MKCENCGFENNGKAKFCTRCGASLAQKNEVQTQQKDGNNTKYLIVGLTALIIVLICAIGYFAINLNDGVQIKQVTILLIVQLVPHLLLMNLVLLQVPNLVQVNLVNGN